MAAQLLQNPFLAGPQSAPTCLRCGQETERLITRWSNRNGNAGRPYYKCLHCGGFNSFADDRGNDAGNPLCDCGQASRRQISGVQRGRRVHYVCRFGRCDYFTFHWTAENKVMSLTEDVVEWLARLRLV